MNSAPPQFPPDKPPTPKKSPALALILGFLPSVLLLGIFAWFSRPAADGKLEAVPLLIALVVSVGCCFSSAILLFSRNTGLAIAAGVIFLLLNGAISLVFGCGAAFSVH